MAAPQTDSSLLRRIADPYNERAWREFYELYSRLIYAFALRAGADGQMADEVVQETMIDLATRRMQTYDRSAGRGRFSTYLYSIARRRVADAYRRHKRRRQVSLNNTVGEEDTEWIDLLEDPHRELQHWWDRECLQALHHEAMRRVQENYGMQDQTLEVFRLSVAGQTAEAIAEKLGIARDTVYQNVKRVREKLKIEYTLLREEWGL